MSPLCTSHKLVIRNRNDFSCTVKEGQEMTESVGIVNGKSRRVYRIESELTFIVARAYFMRTDLDFNT